LNPDVECPLERDHFLQINEGRVSPPCMPLPFASADDVVLFSIMMTTEALMNEALALPLAERSYVAERLLRSLEDDIPLSDAWREEVERRIARRERGESHSFSREEVRRDAAALLA
jgi:putative addiction module component (TIGR02574 family)